MLKHLSSIYEYRDFLSLNKDQLDPSQLRLLKKKPYCTALHKLWKLDPGLASDTIFAMYSSTGRPARDPAVLIRSFLLMLHMGYLSIDNWCDQLQSNTLLQYLTGSFDPPCAASHYDFINRFTRTDPHLSELHPKTFFKKPDKLPAEGEKLINFTKEDTYSLADKYKNGAECDHDRYLYPLQLLFNQLAVIPSMDMGFIDQKNLILSGDGSSLHIHASKYGHKVIKDGKDDDNIYRYSAPDADVGWDSDLNVPYLGFTFYSIDYHNKAMKTDLPVFIDQEKASRHDALNCISSSARMLDINPDLRPKYMCLDSASDANAIYQFYQHNHIIPVIDHNQRRDKNKKVIPETEHLDSDGTPICSNGTRMTYAGYDNKRFRKKYRCPLITGKIDHCPFQDSCSTSSYGRTVYVRDDASSPRNSGPLPYKSDHWVKIYKNRTCCERINTRVLNDYHLHQMRIRNGSKHAFFAIFAGISIHLDAWIKMDQ